MKRILLLLLVGVLFAACAPASSSETTVSIPDEPERPETAVVEETEDVESANEPSDVTESEGDALIDASDIENFPATNIAEASIVRERDWKLGSDDPLVTIIEYGDFQ